MSSLSAVSAEKPSGRVITEGGGTGAFAPNPAMRSTKQRRRTMESLLQLQQSLADQRAKELVLSLPAKVMKSQVWRDTTDCDHYGSVKYLSLRGLLKHHPDYEELVMLKEV